MATKDFTSKLKKAAADKPEEIGTPAAEPTKARKKVGRPKTKTEPSKLINIAVPVSVMEKVEIAKASYDGNLTEYINVLIQNDLQEHFEEYQTTYNVLNKYKKFKH